MFPAERQNFYFRSINLFPRAPTRETRCRQKISCPIDWTPGSKPGGVTERVWDATDSCEVRDWLARNEQRLVPVEIEGADGTWFPALAPADIEARLAALRPPTSRLRILCPFDPVVRDRARLERLLGFEYRIEIFVPAAKRRWGYYVYPLLEGARFVGRIDVKADRDAAALTVVNLWPEPGVAWTGARQLKLEAELARLARFVGIGATGAA